MLSNYKKFTVIYSSNLLSIILSSKYSKLNFIQELSIQVLTSLYKNQVARKQMEIQQKKQIYKKVQHSNLQELEQAYQIRVSVYFQANVRLENMEQINLQGYYEPIIFDNIYKKQLVIVGMFKLALKIIIFILGLLTLIIIIKWLKNKQMQKMLRFEATTDAHPNIEMNQQKFIN